MNTSSTHEQDEWEKEWDAAIEAELLKTLSPEDRKQYEERKMEIEALDAHYAQPVTMKRGDLEALEQSYAEELSDMASVRDEALADAEKTHRSLSYALTGLGQASANTENARTHQSAQDKIITKLRKRIKELESERDAARLAYLELLEKTEAAKGHATK